MSRKSVERGRREHRGKIRSKVIDMAELSVCRIPADVVDEAAVVYSKITGKRAKVKDITAAAFEFYIKHAEELDTSAKSTLGKTGTEN